MPAGWVEESVHSRVPPPPQPWASDSPSPQPLKAHLPHLAPLSRKPKHGTEETGGERDRKKQREEERPPSVHRHFPADPERPLPSPPPSWHSWAEKDEGGGGGVRERSRGTPHPASNPGPSPSTATPPCPRGSQDGVSDTMRVREALYSKRRNQGWKGEWGPTGIERCQAGGQRAGSSGRRRRLQAAGHDRLDARPSVPLSIQGGSSLGGSEARRALLKSFLCVCVLIT